MSPHRETINWQGITLSVAYTENYAGAGVHRLEIHAIAPAGAALPITETGYRSHFFYEPVEPIGGAVGYVRKWLDEAATTPE